MRIIFMGTPEFAVASAEALRNSAHEIIAVVTVPDKPAGRGLQQRQSAVKQWALAHGLPILQPQRLRDAEFIEAVRALAPDLIVVVAFRILPKEIYTVPVRGSFNLHASLLPKYRGAAPINWAIINGEKETGVTSFFLQETVDTGSVIMQRRTEIGADETAGELHDRLAVLGAGVVVLTADLIGRGNIDTTKQDDAFATPAPKLTTATGRIAWNTSAETIHNLVRGLSPVPAAWTTLDSKTVKILRTLPTDLIPEPAAPGECVVEHGRLFVKTEDVMIEIMELQREGRKLTTGIQFVQGRGAASGVMFE
jgi:methionyl-tRNA formyltransferase